MTGELGGGGRKARVHTRVAGELINKFFLESQNFENFQNRKTANLKKVTSERIGVTV